MSNFKYQLSIASIMKYENDHVVEWIEYHHCIGVDHFYIYDNDENSGLLELLDYFINIILKKYNISGIPIITNHGEFVNGKLEISYPYAYEKCGSGTCKCKAISDFRKHYKTIYYCGDGISDYCVADKADVIFAKSRLLNYCHKNNINCIEFENGWGSWIRTSEMTESKSVALPLGYTPINKNGGEEWI